MPKLSQAELHLRFLSALGQFVSAAHDTGDKPLEVDVVITAPLRLRVYLFNATRPPGGRPTGEHKIQLIVPGQARGQRGDFDRASDRTVVLMGYQPEMDVFVVWDADLYRSFSYSRNVQVKGETVYAAYAGEIAVQSRRTARASESVVACRSARLAEGIKTHLSLILERLLN